MRVFILTVAFVFTATLGTAFGQTAAAESPGGDALQQIAKEQDPMKRTALLEAFVAQNPAHARINWAQAQLAASYNEAKQYQKAGALAQKVLAADPNNVTAAHEAIRAAEGLNNSDQVLAAAIKATQVAKTAISSNRPSDPEAGLEWDTNADLAHQLLIYAEYALLTQARTATDPKKKLQFVEEAEKVNPEESEYGPELNVLRFHALRGLGQNAKAMALAESVIAKDKEDDDMLLAAASAYAEQKGFQKALDYASQVLANSKKKQKPEGMSDADWKVRQNYNIGMARLTRGMVFANQGKWGEADTELRPALALFGNNQQLRAAALFYLGLANYNLGEKSGQMSRIIDSLKFSQECAKIRSPYQAQAQNNVNVLRRNYVIK